MTGIAERPTLTNSKHSLTPRQRKSLQSHLMDDREKTRTLIDAITLEMGAFVEARRDTATDDEHDPEGPTLAFERSQSSAILAQSRQHLAEIDAALVRMTEGTYGLCRNCGDVIPIGRLQVRPQAAFCIRCAERR
ncbi:MAG TPA: TraR/DksA C4-type zinc finger protein [Galbitalea sp.]|jgi:RNA polymerase-binding transcription factor DksA